MTELRYREALNEALREELQRDERVLLLGEDIGVFGGAFRVTAGLLEGFGERRGRGTPPPGETNVGGGGGGAAGGRRAGGGRGARHFFLAAALPTLAPP